jgi:hypothetical protein
MKRSDQLVLMELASEVAEIAALPAQQETIALWKGLNGLRPARPMVMIDELPWNEMDVDGELTLQTKDEFCRGLEATLRRTLCAWRHFRVDMVVEPVIDIPKVIRTGGFGVGIEETTLATAENNVILSHHYVDQLRTEDDVEKIRVPVVTLDEGATASAEARAHEIFDGILDVRMQGMFLNYEIWDDITMRRGAENVLFDLIDRPAFMHTIASRYIDAKLGMLDQLEARGLLGYGQPRIHCTGAHTDELPAQGFESARPRAKDNWTCGMAQIFGSVSPAMYEEFEVDYAIRWYSRFGLGYYGCCEPLHDRVDIIRRIPNVRKISMSAWADVDRGAEAIGRDFVFSRKPSPALVALETWEPEAIEKDLRRTLDACARHGCPVEITLKDISTVRNQPQRVWEWAEIASRLVGR